MRQSRRSHRLNDAERTTTMRVLLITQMFHPTRSIYAIRWTALADGMQTAGHEVGVICRRDLGDGEESDGRVILEFPTRGATASGQSPTVGGRSSARTWAIRWLTRLAMPDVATIQWFRRRGALIAAARTFAPDLLISTSPPHGLHLVGRWLSRRVGAPWVADFRDPYVGDARFDVPAIPPWRQAHRFLERAVVRRANLVLTAGAAHLAQLVQRYPEQADRFTYIPNGFTPASLPQPTASPSGQIELAVIGTAAADELRTVARAAAACWPDGVRLHTIGLSEPQVRGLREHLDVVAHDWLTGAEQAAIVRSATILLLVLAEDKGAGGGTSTKLYQYIDARRPVLAVNPTASDLDLLRQWTRFVEVRTPTVRTAELALSTLAGCTGDGPEVDDFRRTHGWPAVAERFLDALEAAGIR
jgi:hypothetical protein